MDTHPVNRTRSMASPPVGRLAQFRPTPCQQFPRPQPSTQSNKSVARNALPAFALVLTGFIPAEFALYLGALKLTYFRLTLILVAPIVLQRFFSQFGLRLSWFDFFFLALAVWTLVAYLANYGMAGGLESGGIMVLETYIAYLVGRVYLTGIAPIQLLMKVSIFALGIVLFATIPEAIFGQHFVHDFAQAVTGNPTPYQKYDFRMGIWRAAGPFDHPIIYGAFSASLFALNWFVCKGLMRLVNSAIIGISVFLTASSGPMLVMLISIALIGWRYVTGNFTTRTRWQLVGVMFGLLVIMVNLLAANPLSWFITYLTLNPTTGWERYAQWQYGLAAVSDSPFFGIGNEVFARADWMSWSVDSLWLVFLTSIGFPGMWLLLGGVLSLVIKVAKTDLTHDKNVCDMRVAWVFSMLSLCIAGIVVHFWGSMLVYFFMFAGAGGWYTQVKQRVPRPPTESFTNKRQSRPRPGARR